MPSPLFKINGGSPGVKASVGAGTTVTATLDSIVGVRSTSWQVINTDETTVPASYSLVTSGAVNQTVETTALTAGTAAELKCTINGGIDPETDQPSAAMSTTSKFYVVTAEGMEVLTAGELARDSMIASLTHGAVEPLNEAIRIISSGTGSEKDWKDSCRTKTSGALPAYTRTVNELVANSNGALPSVGGVTLALTESLLIDSLGSASDVDNGLYTVTDLGSAGTPWKMERRNDADSSAEMTSGVATVITEGTYAGLSYWLSTPDPIALNTDALTFAQFVAGIGGSGTDNHVMRWDGTVLAQDSGVVVDDSDNVTGVTTLEVDDGGAVATTGTVAVGASGSIVGLNGSAQDTGMLAMSSGDLLVGYNATARPTNTFVDGETSTVLWVAGTPRLTMTGSYCTLAAPRLRWTSTIANPEISYAKSTISSDVGDALAIYGQDMGGGGTDCYAGPLSLRSGGDDGATATNVHSGNFEIYCGAIKGSGTRGNVYVGVNASGTAANRCDTLVLDGHAAVRLRYQGNERLSVLASTIYASVNLQCYADLLFDSANVTPTIYQSQHTSGDGTDLIIQAQQGAATFNGGDLILRPGISGAGGSANGNLVLGNSSNLPVDIIASASGAQRFYINTSEIVRVNSAGLQFNDDHSGPAIKQEQHATSNGVDLLIQAQQGAATFDGGDLYLRSGAKGAGGSADGYVLLNGEQIRVRDQTNVTDYAYFSNARFQLFVSQLYFDDAVTSPIISQEQHATGDGADLTVQAQQGAATFDGGDLSLRCAAKGAGGTYDGSIRMRNAAGGTILAVADVAGVANFAIGPAMLAPQILQEQHSTSHGADLTIQAQQGATGAFDGGDLILTTGADGGSGNDGVVRSRGYYHVWSDRSGGTVYGQLTSTQMLLFGDHAFAAAVGTPKIYQQQHATGDGADLTVQAQQGATGAYDGGDLILSGGIDGGSAADGAVRLRGTAVWFETTAGSDYGYINSTEMQLSVAKIEYERTVSSPSIEQEVETVASTNGDNLTVKAQGVSAATGTALAGNLVLAGGVASGSGTNSHGNVAFRTTPSDWHAMEGGVFFGDAGAAPDDAPTDGFFLHSNSGRPVITFEDQARSYGENVDLSAWGSVMFGTAATTSTTWVDIITYTPGGDGAVLIEAGCSGSKSGTSTTYYGLLVAATASISGGTVTCAVGDNTVIHEFPLSHGTIGRIVASGSDIVVQVQSPVSENWNWNAWATFRYAKE